MAIHRGMGHSRGSSLKHLRPVIGSKKPPEQERGCCQPDHAVTEAAGHSVGQALNRCPSGLRLLHQTNDSGQCGLSADTGDLHQQRSLKIQAAGGQLCSLLRLQRHWLAGEAGDING